ncbi:phenol hydroxylase subunit [Caldimonas tepidiphila]|uniref:phenol hydroxylase subunit n=1 Tax=Caldimonas tepidiphila TaxID=2315841 RepID=UPI000E5B6E76|nr:phenol hydroxylase subunit [Caldimonas tepidiphila]
MDTTQHPDPATFDPRRKFVRLMDSPREDFVAFEFSIGTPELAVELLLPVDAFEEFCATNRVERLEA